MAMHFFRAFGHGAIVDDGPCLCGVINFCLGSLLARVALTWKSGHGTVSSAILSGLTRRGMVCGVFAASFEREGPHDVPCGCSGVPKRFSRGLSRAYPIRMGRERGLRGAAGRGGAISSYPPTVLCCKGTGPVVGEGVLGLGGLAVGVEVGALIGE